MKTKPKVGQTLFSLNMGNAARNCEQVLTRGTVISVGTKYFVWRRDGEYPISVTFSIEDWRQKTQYSSDHELYESEQEWADKRESAKIAELIRKRFDFLSRHGLTLEQLRQIKAIISP